MVTHTLIGNDNRSRTLLSGCFHLMLQDSFYLGVLFDCAHFSCPLPRMGTGMIWPLPPLRTLTLCNVLLSSTLYNVLFCKIKNFNCHLVLICRSDSCVGSLNHGITWHLLFRRILNPKTCRKIKIEEYWIDFGGKGE